MAPADVPLKGVHAYVSCFLEDGTSCTAATQKAIVALGGTIVKRLATATHVFCRGDYEIYREAKLLKKRLVETEWVEVCKALGDQVPTKTFEPPPPPSPGTRVTKTGKVVPVAQAGGGAKPRRRSGKSSLETDPQEIANLPSPSAECFSSSQLQDPVAQKEASVRIRGRRRSSAATKKLKRTSDPPAAIQEEDEIEEFTGEQSTWTPSAALAKITGRRTKTPGSLSTSAGKKVAAKKAESSDDEDEEEVDELEEDEEQEEEEEEGALEMYDQVQEEDELFYEAHEEQAEPHVHVAVAPAGNANSQAVLSELTPASLLDEAAVNSLLSIKSASGHKNTAEKKKRKRGTPPPQWEPISATTTGGWDCGRCTYANRARAKLCEMCNFARDGVLEEKKEEPPKKGNTKAVPPASKKPRTSSGSSKSNSGGQARAASTTASSKPQKKKAAAASTTPKSSSSFAAAKAKKQTQPKKTTKKQKPAAAAAPASKRKAATSDKKAVPSPDAEPEGVVLAVSGMDGEVRATLAAEMRGLGKTVAATEKKATPPPKLLQTDDPSVPFTHLLVPSDRECRRTLKVLFALCSGAHIVTAEWLLDSAAQGRWLPEADYAIERFQRRATPEERHVMAGEKVLLGPCGNPARRILGRLVTAAGGELESKLRDDTSLVVLQPGEPADEWMRALLDKKSSAALLQTMLEDRAVVQPSFVFEGIDAGVLAEDTDEYAVPAPQGMALGGE